MADFAVPGNTPRLNVISIMIPPMRERKEEILALAEYFLRKYATSDTVVPQIETAVKHYLLAYDWPGNVRELENMMRRYLVLRDGAIFRDLVRSTGQAIDAGGNLIKADDNRLVDRSIFESLDETKRKAQINDIVAALDASQWNRKKAAGLLRLDYKQLLYQMKKLQVEGANRRTRSRGGPKQAGGSRPKPAAGPSLLEPWLPVRQLS